MSCEEKPIVEVYGRALQSTIQVINQLGDVGQSILEQSGALNLKEDGLYPPVLRANLYDSLLDRYGPIGMRSIGFEMGNIWEKIFPSFFKDALAKGDHPPNVIAGEYASVQPTIKGIRLTISIDQCFSIFTASWNLAVQMFCKTNDPSYRSYCKRQKDLRYEFGMKSPGVFLRHKDFFLTNLDRQLTSLLGRDFHVSIELDEKKTEDDLYGCGFVYQVEFIKKKVRGKVDDLIKKKQKLITEEFLRSVLNYSETQKKLAEDKGREAISQKERVERISLQLSKYLPSQIHSALMDGDHNTDIVTRRKKLTIFFSDIANFTSTSEGLQPEDLTKYLNEYFSEMTKIALDFGATIDKYIGDAMMVFFGDQNSHGERDDARACVQMALKMQERMGELQVAWQNQGFADPFQVRIGLNTGYCNVGNFGSDQRLTYTIIGGEVNIAQRLESNADLNGILMSYETYAHAQDLVEVEERDTIKMKGINREIKIFSVKKRRTQMTNRKDIISGEENNKSSLLKDNTLERRVANLETKLDMLLKKIENIT